MSIFGDFDQIRQDQREWRKQAEQTFVPGIDPAELKPGMRVTISPNLRISDRSYTDQVHEVVAVNTSHVQTRTKGYDGKPRLLMLLAHEHHFYDASSFEVEPDNRT